MPTSLKLLVSGDLSVFKGNTVKSPGRERLFWLQQTEAKESEEEIAQLREKLDLKLIKKQGWVKKNSCPS